VSARQFIKVYLDVDASLAARAVAAFVEHSCASGTKFSPTEIVEAEFRAALGMGRTATRMAIKEAVGNRLVTRARSKRGDGRGVYVYTVVDEGDTPAVPFGSLYVVEFSNGIVKVGKSFIPTRRLEQHRLAAEAFGLHIVRSWVSERTDRYDEAETKLLGCLGRRRGESEFFTGGYDNAVAVAQHVIGGTQ
jgi:hypothetical protein